MPGRRAPDADSLELARLHPGGRRVPIRSHLRRRRRRNRRPRSAAGAVFSCSAPRARRPERRLTQPYCWRHRRSRATGLPSADLGTDRGRRRGRGRSARRPRAACRIARLADAIAAAGGFATDADLEAAAALNLAQPLTGRPAGARAPRSVTAPRAVAPCCRRRGGRRWTAAAALVEREHGHARGARGTPGHRRRDRPEDRRGAAGAAVQLARRTWSTAGVIHRGQLEDITGLATAG